MAHLPTGTVTFLFTDLEGSTRLLADLGGGYADVLTDHRRLLRAAFQAHGGREVDTQGDAFFVAFSRAREALAAALAAQRAVAAHAWPHGVSPRVRMGLHTGEPVSAETGYVGMDVHRAARICAAGHGGQVLLSQTTYDLVEDDLPEDVSLRDLGEHRLKDLTRPQRLYQVVTGDLPSEFPPLTSLDVLPNNLPVQLSSFIGREQERDGVKRLLVQARLLTLTGAGGAGKTRLALQAAAELLEDYRDGVWLVELASLSDPELLPQAVASVLTVREQPGRPVLDVVIDVLRPKRLLLILDNCEHMVAVCGRLADNLLRACPHLRILATSRERLGIAGETAWRVPSLSTPDPQNLPPLERLGDFEAVRLFLERAAASLPAFVLTNEDAPAVARICAHLGGIPLAVELAAARVAALSPGQIAERLGERLDLLRGGSHGALPRHQTLKAALDWSYDLLAAPEARMFRRLSVFAGGFELEAAERVCGGEAWEELEVLDLLTRLVEKSLVLAERQAGAMRYRLLDPVRQYTREKLQESGEAEAVSKRHLDFFLALVEEAEPHLKRTVQSVWLRRLDGEYDNIREGLKYALAAGYVEEALRIGGALWWFWFVRGYESEGRHWLEQALSPDAPATRPARARALSGAGVFAAIVGDLAAARAWHDEAVEIWRQLGDRQEYVEAQAWRAHAVFLQGDAAGARALAGDALEEFAELRDDWGGGLAANVLGEIARYEGRYEEAEQHYERSLTHLRRAGETFGTSVVLHNLSQILLQRGEARAAGALLQESLVISRELTAYFAIPYALMGLGGVAALEGRPGRAARLLAAADALVQATGAPMEPQDRASFDLHVARTRALIDAAEFNRAWAEGQAMRREQAVAYALADSAETPPGAPPGLDPAPAPETSAPG